MNWSHGRANLSITQSKNTGYVNLPSGTFPVKLFW